MHYKFGVYIFDRMFYTEYIPSIHGSVREWVYSLRKKIRRERFMNPNSAILLQCYYLQRNESVDYYRLIGDYYRFTPKNYTGRIHRVLPLPK